MSGNFMNQTIAINTITPHVRDILTACLKWVRRIEDRNESLPASFMDGIDIAPLRREVENILAGETLPRRISDDSAKRIELAFIESGAQP